MRVLSAVCLLLISTVLVAKSATPDGCKPIAVQGETVTLNAKNNKLILINNLAKNDLWITHPIAEPSASAGWTTRLQAGNWSALAVNKGPFVISCIESRPGHEQQIPCEGAIAVCQLTGVKFPAGEQNTYWAGEDLSLEALKTALSGRGFVLPVKKGSVQRSPSP